MAKNCEVINNFFDEDPWERNEYQNESIREKLVEQLIQLTKKESNPYFKRKYAFLTIRLAYYANKKEVIKSVFEDNFNESNSDYLYYWSSFFYCFANPSNAMITAANLMANSPEKRYASYYYFHSDFKIEKALQQAKNKQEIANAYAYASVQKKDKNLGYLQQIYVNNPKSEMFPFLLLRELNKIEDWVYTPYYSNYTPSLDTEGFWSDDNTTETLRLRSEKDRVYAQEVLDFVDLIAVETTHDAILFKAVQINLEFITRNYSDCLQNIADFEKKYSNEKVFEQIEKIKALCLTANQEMGKAIILPEIESIVLKYKHDERFIFALGRELEYKGNIADGVALISLNESVYPKEFNGDDVEWQANRIKTSGNLEVFYSYFDYLDFVYSAKDLQQIVTTLRVGVKTDFQKSIYRGFIRERESLIDLLGTKYIRENQFSNALITFKSLGKKYWEANYNAWERGRYGEGYSFEQNPFYDIPYTKAFIPHQDSFIVTKISITEHLIKYTNLANNPNTKDRDYYYFLLANCYYNMSDYGNSWLMRRYMNSSSYWDKYQNESYIDEMEYRNKIKAVANFKLAFENAKTPKFKALCLRMMDYAEKHTFSSSKRVAAEFPDFSSDLSGCENLGNYFKSRR